MGGRRGGGVWKINLLKMFGFALNYFLAWYSPSNCQLSMKFENMRFISLTSCLIYLKPSQKKFKSPLPHPGHPPPQRKEYYKIKTFYINRCRLKIHDFNLSWPLKLFFFNPFNAGCQGGHIPPPKFENHFPPNNQYLNVLFAELIKK